MPLIIMVAEDEFFVRIAIAQELRGLGHQIIEAHDADEARAVIEAGQHIDLLFSDVNMPGEMDGLALARWLRAERPEVKIILTTGAIGMKRDEALTQYDGFIAKPYMPHEVEAAIARFVSAGLKDNQDVA